MCAPPPTPKHTQSTVSSGQAAGHTEGRPGGAGTSTARGNPDAGATDLKQQQQQHFRKQK